MHKGTREDLAVTDSSGYFQFTTNQNESITFFGYIGDYKVFGYRLNPEKDKNTYVLRIVEGQGLDLLPLTEITVGRERPPFIEEINPRDIQMNPTTGGGIESIIKTLGGVGSGNELSSQYNVRGGSFDENLIYVNDIEIYRPQLIHSGQQEGLSFINPDLVKSIKFSAGGFEAQYGDKMSSVLDVEYYKADSFRASANLGILLNSLSLEGKEGRVRYIAGVRYFTNSLLTRSLDVQGAYRMQFADFQTLIEVKLTPRLYLDFLGNVAINRYSLNPTSRQTEFGTVQQAYQLDVAMAGAESMHYNYGMGAVTLRHNIDSRRELKWIFSATGSDEQEFFDIEGAYYLRLLDRDLGSRTLGKPLQTLGFGYFLDHGRNKMQTSVLNFSHIGSFGKFSDRSQFKYGIRINYESIFDKYKEWRYNDSADYNIPPFGFATDSIVLDDVVNKTNEIVSLRGQMFVQNRWRLSKEKAMWLGAGIRGQWWQLNNEYFVSPRIQFSWEPHKMKNKLLPDSLKRNELLIKLAAGAYYQPAFYREMRDFQGNLNKQLTAQRTLHFVAGMDRYFLMWDRKFKLTTEAYYKPMWNQVPYLYDNIRIRYYATNSSNGYAWGVDNRINGEFIKGLESWFTLSMLQTKETILYTDDNGNEVKSAMLRRPTDRRVNFAAVFQDQLAKNPSIRVNLSLMVGTGIPYYLDGKARYSKTPGTIPPYRRLDLGFSKVLKTADGKIKTNIPVIKNSANAWISLEVFNILGINNVIAYSWVKDISNNTYGVPEYLTGRRINLRLHIEI